MTGKGRFCFSDCADCLTENPRTTAEFVKTKVGGADTVPSKLGPDRDDDVEMVLEVITPVGGEGPYEGEVLCRGSRGSFNHEVTGICCSDCAACLPENSFATAESLQTKVGGAETVLMATTMLMIPPARGVLPKMGKCSVAISQSITAGHKNYHSLFTLPYRPIF